MEKPDYQRVASSSSPQKHEKINDSIPPELNYLGPSEFDESYSIENISSPNPPELCNSATIENVIYSSQPGPDNSGKLGKSSSSSPPDRDESGTLKKISSLALPAHGDSDTLEKDISSSSPEPDNSGELGKDISSSSPEPDNSGELGKLSCPNPPEVSDCGTLDNISSSSITELVDSDTLEKDISSSPSEPGKSILVFEELQNTVTMTYIYSSKELRAKMKQTQKKYTNEEASEFKKMLIESRKNMHIMFMTMNNYINNLVDTLNKGMKETVIPYEKPSDGESLKQISDTNSFAKTDDILYRSLTRTILKDYEDESDMEPCEPHKLVVIDDILDKCRRARKLAKWFILKVLNHEILCNDILYTFIYHSLGLTNYANLIDTCLRVSDGIDKEKMYNIYMKYHKDDFENHYLIKLHQSEIYLEESNKKYKIREARKTRFKKGRSCRSEHTTPFCELCGWQSTWLKTFEKRGIYIREAPHWTTDHIWYNEINYI